MKVRLDETLFKTRAQENLAMTNDIDKFGQVDALVECLDHFVADRKWVDEVTRDELLTMVTQSHGDKDALVESVLAKFNTPCIDAKKLKECRERRQNKGLKESMKKRKSLKESDNRDTFTLDTSNTPILDVGLYYSFLYEIMPSVADQPERFKEFEDCVKECAEPILDELVRKTPNFEVVSVGTYYHPRYYNYETDSLEFTVKYTGDELGTVIEEYSNNQDFIDFLQNYKSYDGFISFYADNKEDFVTQDYIKSVSQIIKYNVTQEDYERANEELYYDVSDCGFYPDDYEDEMEEGLKEKKYDIYVNGKYVASSDRHKRAKDIEDNIRKDGKIKYAGEKAIKTAGVELDELNVDAKDKLKVKRARESKENKNLFAYRIYMRDKDKDFASGKDYKDAKSMLQDAKKDFELANNELRTNPKYLICMLFDFVDGEYYHYKDLYSVKEIEDEIKLEATPSKKECKSPKKESKQLKEGYYGQTLQDFLDDCMDYSVIDKIYIYGNDDVVYEGPIDDIPEDMLDTEFLECDMYTNRKSVVTVNVDSSEEYGAGMYEFLNEFLDDCNCELVVIYDLAEGEEIFNGYKEDIPEEYLEYAFASYDAPEEMSVNLNDYEGEDDFDESLDRYSKETKDFANKLCRLAKKDNRQLKFEDACEVIDQSFNDNSDNIEDFYKRLNFDENLKESLEDDMEKLSQVVSARKDGGKYILKLKWQPTRKKAHSDYVDLTQALKKKFGDVNIKLQTQEWRDNNKETRYILEVELKDKEIKEDISPLAKKMGAKFLPPKDYGVKKRKPRYVYEVYYYDTEDCTGDPIFRKFSSRKAQEEWYEKHKDDPDKFDMYAYPDASIYENLKETCSQDYLKYKKQLQNAKSMDELRKVWQTIKKDLDDDMSFDEDKKLSDLFSERKKELNENLKEVYNTEDRIKELKKIKKTRALTDDEAEELAYCENEVDSRNAETRQLNGENLKESTIPVKDLLVKTDNKYDITLDHAIDDIKRERGYNDPLFGDNEVIDLLMKRYGLEKRDVIRVLNYKFDGKVLDEGCGRKKIGKRAK